MPGIFISYRREDSPGHAGRIFDRLRSRFGSDVVFMDVAAIEPGVDFVEVLHKAVGSCDALLAVIGPQWLSATHDGKRRLDDPRDFVRIEIAGALQRNVRVLPVLVEGASLPPADSLPADLHALARRQAIDLRDARWDDDIDRLVEGLEKFLKPAVVEARGQAKRSPGRGIAIGVVAALILVVAALAWRGGFLPGGRSGTPVRPIEDLATATPAQPAAAPPPTSAPASSPTPASAAAPPDVTGKTILEARAILQRAGFRFLIRLREDRSRAGGIVEAQQLDESTGTGQPRRVILSAVATSTVVVHVAKGDEQKAESLVTFLKSQSSTIGSIVRAQSVGPRAELVGVVGYSEDRLAAQAEAIAQDSSQYLARTGSKRSLQAAVRPRIVRGTILVGLYERAP